MKRISAESLVGRGEYAKQAAIIDAFSNAYKSDASIIIIDDIDRIMGACTACGFRPLSPRVC